MPTRGTQHACEQTDCSTTFNVTHHLQKYCLEHRTTETRRLADLPDARAISKPCENPMCNKLVRGKRALKKSVKYCDDACSKQAQWTRSNDKRTRENRQAVLDTSGVEKARKGEIYKRLKTSGDGERIDAGEISPQAVSLYYDTTPATISRAMEAWRFDRDATELKDSFEWSWRVKALFPKEKMERAREIGLELRKEALKDDEFNRLIDELVRAFATYSKWYFKFKKKRVINKAFHLRWIRSILVAYATGGKQYILSPPRHGKSEILIRLFIWQIIMDHDIRIGWLAASTKIAKVMLGKVKAYLEHNDALIADTLPEGEAYKPHRNSGKSKILSLDFDELCVDDIEDFDTCRDADQREYSKDKFLEFGTRKEEDTVWFGIGSRQHPDDIPHSLIEGGEDEEGLSWAVMVDAAHDDDGCSLDPEVIEGHDENGCVLFPEIRSYRWLMEKKQEEAKFGEAGRYEMRYLNRPRPTTGLVFDMTLIQEYALDRSLGLGLEGLPPGRLIAGLDPASRGTQAAVLWHYANGALTVVDIETQEAGGFAGALRVMQVWHEKYDLRDWIYEDNAQQSEFFLDPRLKALVRELGLSVRNHTTGKNKQDPELGISAMAPMYHDGTIRLPFGTAEARLAIGVLLRQLELWTTDGLSQRKKGKTDVKMASWLPFPRLLRWFREETVQTAITDTGNPSYPSAYRGSSAPWTTRYPTGT